MRVGRIRAVALAALALSLLPAPARAEPLRFLEGADEPVPKPKGELWDASIWARIRPTAVSSFPLDETGTRNDQRYYVESRLRVGGAWLPRREFEVHTEIDILSGIMAGNLTEVGTGPGEDTLRFRLDKQFGVATFDLRQLYFLIRSPVGEVRFGRQTSAWGLGMMANDGSGEPDFGDRRLGDLDYRLSFATKPFSWIGGAPRLLKNLAIFAAADFVYKDDQATQPLGDTAFQGVLGIRTQSEVAAFGVLESVRFQRDREDPVNPGRGHTRVTASTTDAWLSVLLARTRNGMFRIEAEGAMIIGDTDRPYLDESKDGAAIRAFGGVLRLRYDDPTLRLTVKSEIGYASGDNDPHDNVVRTFSFDPDYKVGLILFDQVLARLSARAADRLTDPGLAAVPPSATRFIPTQGSVTNAIYANPVARLRPLPGVDLRLGYLLAFSAGDLVDPYNSVKAGGYNATYGGKSPGSRALGHEVDLSARYRVRLYRDLAIRIGAEGGLFFPGRAFDGVAGAGGMGTVWSARGLADITW